MENYETSEAIKILQNLLKKSEIEKSVKDKNILSNGDKSKHGK